ncbi:MAG: outer membrane beta-barrel protein, partial [Pseudomonadota bacterium]|nr:outer membrane beta-barrel protein [Pseudomonadota bacterium]
MNCKSYLAGASLPAMIVALTAASHAADYAPAPTFDWSGFYIGAHAGYGDFDNDGFFATSVDMQFAGGDFIGGGQAGWNMQRNSWVFGVEQDISFLEWTGKNVREEQYIAEADFLATLRGRVGWADDNVLFYGTAGGALLNAEVSTSIGGPDLDQQGNEDGKDVSALGIVLGGGIEWGMTRNLSVKAEALYFIFDEFYKLNDLDEGCPDPDPDSGCLTVGPPNNFSIDDGFVFRLGANWRFGGGADEPGDEEALAATLPSHDWTGFYLGLHAGYGGFDTDGIYIQETGINDRVTGSGAVVPVLLEEFDNHGLLGGVQIGFNWQVGSLLLGVEGDISGVDWNNVLPDVQVPVEPVIMALDVDFLATARARAGWVRNNILYYITGGAAFMESELSVRAASLNGTPTDPDSKDISAIAPVIGGGVEWKYTPNLSFKAEGLYLAFDEDVDLADFQGSGRPGDHIEIEDGFLFRLGANWQLWQQDSEMGAAWYPAADVTHAGPRYDWTGFYVGGHVGWGGLVTDGIFNPTLDGATELTANQAIDLTGVNDLGVLGGGQVGFNWQT